MISPVRRSPDPACPLPLTPGTPAQGMPTRSSPPAGHQSKPFHPPSLRARGSGSDPTDFRTAAQAASPNAGSRQITDLRAASLQIAQPMMSQ